MYTTIIKTLLFLFLCITSNLFQSNAYCFLGEKIHVYVANNLGPNVEPLIAHCASKDNDFGNTTIYANNNFHFHFCTTPFEDTLFFCHLWWGSKQRAFEVFNINHNRCTEDECYWEAKEDGIYFSKYYPKIVLTKLYNWE